MDHRNNHNRFNTHVEQHVQSVWVLHTLDDQFFGNDFHKEGSAGSEDYLTRIVLAYGILFAISTGKLNLRGIEMFNGHPFETAIASKVDRTPVSKPGDCQPGNTSQRDLVVQRRCQCGSSLGKECRTLLRQLRLF